MSSHFILGPRRRVWNTLRRDRARWPWRVPGPTVVERQTSETLNYLLVTRGYTVLHLTMAISPPLALPLAPRPRLRPTRWLAVKRRAQVQTMGVLGLVGHRVARASSTRPCLVETLFSTMNCRPTPLHPGAPCPWPSRATMTHSLRRTHSLPLSVTIECSQRHPHPSSSDRNRRPFVDRRRVAVAVVTAVRLATAYSVNCQTRRSSTGDRLNTRLAHSHPYRRTSQRVERRLSRPPSRLPRLVPRCHGVLQVPHPWIYREMGEGKSGQNANVNM